MLLQVLKARFFFYLFDCSPVPCSSLQGVFADAAALFRCLPRDSIGPGTAKLGDLPDNASTPTPNLCLPSRVGLSVLVSLAPGITCF